MMLESWRSRTTTNGRASLGPWWRSAPTGRTVRRRGRWSWRPRGRGEAAFPAERRPSLSCCGCRWQRACQYCSEHSILITQLYTGLKISRAFSYFIFLSEK